MLIALAGCGGGGTPSSQPSGGVDRAKLVEAASCMRSHGFPDFPDPIQDQGTWVIPPPANELTPPPACLSLFRGAKGRPPGQELSAEDIAQRRRWAACIRTNGIPNMPDPDSNGNFNLPAELTPLTNQPKWQDAQTACHSQQPPSLNLNK
jgi:hypothetical protein